MTVDPKLYEEITKTAKEMVRQMAIDIVSVQPMPSDCISLFVENSKSEQELVDEGYEPVSRLKLLYIKPRGDV